MSEFRNKVITTLGQNLLAQNILGVNINFTKIVLGDGSLESDVILSEMTDVINPIIEIPITKFHQNGDNAIVVGGIFSNTQITDGFFYRELGLYADGGAGEVLYCYGNAEENADWIPPSTGNAIIEKFIEILTVIGNAGNATANVVRSTTADEIYSDSSYTGIEGTDNVEDALKYINENMITPQEKTTLGKLVHDGVKLNDLENVEITQFDKPTLPVVTKQGTVKNFDVFNVNEITQKELTGTIASFTSGNVASSSDVVMYSANVLNETFEIYTDGRIVLKNDITELNITLHSNITFAHKRGDKYLAYTLQKYNESTSIFEDLFVGEEIRVLANNDTNLNVVVEEYLREQPLSAGTYRVIRRYRNNKTTCSYQVTGGTVSLYTDETLAYTELKEELIPTSIKNSLKQFSNQNILINSNFRNSVLVNQRGQTIYNNIGYCIDMWKVEGSGVNYELSLTEGFVKIKNNASVGYLNFVQSFENTNFSGTYTMSTRVKGEIGKTVALIFTADGVQKALFHTFTTNDWEVVTMTQNINTRMTDIILRPGANSIIYIDYIKLEKGNIATPFIDDDPATKLAKCQRYLNILDTSIYMQGVIFSTTNVRSTISLAPMRSIPSVTFVGNSISTDVIFAYKGGDGGVNVTNIIIVSPNINNTGIYLLIFQGTYNLLDLGLGGTIMIRNGAKLIISAEI